MSNPFCLHYAPDNASVCVRIALEELGIAYRTVLVDRRAHAHKAPAYLALNPNGLIPVLETPDGSIFETGAILLWLAERDDRLLPAAGDPDRGAALQWLFWLSNTLHTTQRSLFYPDQISNGPPEDLRSKSRNRMISYFDMLEVAKDAPWLDADVSVHGCYLGPILRWSALYGGDTSWFDLSRWPRLQRFARRTESRDAVQKVTAAEGLGPTPFSRPSPCDPAEGVPL